MKAPQAVRTVISHHGTPKGHRTPAVCTLKGLISANGIGPDLCTGRTIEQRANQSAAIKRFRPLNSSGLGQALCRTASLWILVQHAPQRLDLAARAGLLESGFQQFKVHER